MQLTIDREADAAYITFREGPVVRTVELSDVRMIDYGEGDAVRGLELLSVSHGVDLTDLPVDVDAVAAALAAAGIQVRNRFEATGNISIPKQVSVSGYASTTTWTPAPPAAARPAWKSATRSESEVAFQLSR